MIRKYQAYIVGYYGMQNSGDDALLAATLLGCEQHLSVSNALVANAGNLSSARFGFRPTNLRQRQQFPGQNRLSHYLHAAQCERIIFGGGSVLHSKQDINIKRDMMRLSNPEKSMALGVGIESFKDKETEQACQQFLNECGLIAVRDQESFQIATTLAPNANIVKSFDLAPLLVTHDDYKPCSADRRGIVFNVCPAPVNAMGDINHQQENQRLRRLAEIIQAIWELTQEPITLMQFNGHNLLGDVQVTQKLKGMLAGKVPVNSLSYNPDPIQVLNQISSYKLMVGMRLHANIFAYLTNTPAINLGYHPKSAGWSEQIGLSPDYQFNAHSIDRVRLYNNIMNAISTGITGHRLSVEKALEQSLKNWRISHERNTNFSRHPAFQ